MSFYPINPDTAVESFILTDYETQKAYLGTQYNVSQLVPINYTKVALACFSGVLSYAPLRELIYMSFPFKSSEISDEATNDYQSINLKEAFDQALKYWAQDLLGVPPLQCPLGVVTEIQTNVVGLPSGANEPAGGLFNIVTKLKIEWYVIPGSLYS